MPFAGPAPWHLALHVPAEKRTVVGARLGQHALDEVRAPAATMSAAFCCRLGTSCGERTRGGHSDDRGGVDAQ